MRKTYIATTQEAKALFDGTQTAIISKMRVQPDKGWEMRKMHESKGITHFETRKGTYYLVPYTTSPYAIGQEVVVREAWAETCDEYGSPIISFKDGGSHYIGPNNEYLAECNTAWSIDNYPSCGKWQSPATMPVSAARTRFIPVSCEAVRVREFPVLDCKRLPIRHAAEYKSYIVHKLGQSAWDNNDYVFYYKIEKI